MIDYISKFLTNIFGTKSSRDLKKLWPIVDEIKSHEAAIKALSDEELKQKTEGFKDLYKSGRMRSPDRSKKLKRRCIQMMNRSLLRIAGSSATNLNSWKVTGWKFWKIPSMRYSPKPMRYSRIPAGGL